MMICTTPNQTRQPGPPTNLAICSQRWEQLPFPITFIEMMRFNMPVGLLRQGRLADELCITISATYPNINDGRDASGAKLTDAAAASQPHGEPVLVHARKLREAIQ